MTRRFARYAVGALSLSLLLTMAATGTAQAAPGVAKMTVNPAGAVWHNDTVNLVVDFPTGKYDEGTYGNYPYLSVFSSADGTTFNKVAKGVKSDKAGKLTLTYDVGTAKSWVKVCNDKTMPNGQAGKLFNDGVTELCTSTVEFDPKVLPPATADLIVSANGKTATANFGGGALKNGQAATLEIETIVTDMTAEVGVSTWKTIATGKQNASGQVTFTISDPYEVSHNYRAKSGKYTTNVVTLDQAALSASMGKKETGIPQVYFNTNEQTKVNTRTKWSEGRFTMVQAGKNVQFAECNDPIKKHKEKKGQPPTTEVVDTAAKPLVAALKGRGNYSWSFPKKSFSLKLDSKHDICGMGQHKKWALVANHYDKSLLRNTVASYIGSKLDNLAWTAESKPVDFWINGVYQGSYILIERIAPSVKSTTDAGRVPYDAAKTNLGLAGADTPGFLLEWDFRKGADVNVKVNARGYVGIKDPEYDYEKDGKTKKDTGINKEQITYITNYLKDCDNKLFGANFKDSSKGWRSCIDEKSAVDFYIGHELMKTVDGNMWASVYMWKPKDGKLMMGPLWDFDLAAGSANRAGGAVNPTGFYLRNVVKMSAKQSSKTWFNRLNEDPAFRSAVKARWKVVSPAIKGSDAYLASQASKISASASENFKKWDVKRKDSKVQVVKGSWSAEVSYLRSWLKSRIAWLDANF